MLTEMGKSIFYLNHKSQVLIRLWEFDFKACDFLCVWFEYSKIWHDLQFF